MAASSSTIQSAASSSTIQLAASSPTIQSAASSPTIQSAASSPTIQQAATGGVGISSIFMEPAVYRAAKKGNIKTLSKYKGLHQKLTPTKNTVLHIYIACADVISTPSTVSPLKLPVIDPASDAAVIAKQLCPQELLQFFQIGNKALDIATVVKEMLEMCPRLLMQSNEKGDTALHIAARYGQASVVIELIEFSKVVHDGQGTAWPGIISAKNEDGDTALHEAVRFNHFHVVSILTTQDGHQENLHSPNLAGETPLYLAAERGYGKLVVQILASCTDPSAYRGPNGRTALHAAAIRDSKGMTEELLEKRRALTKEVDEQGCTPLHLAASAGNHSVVKLLLDKDISAAYVQDKHKKWTAFHYAANRGHQIIMRQLISVCPDSCELVDNESRNVLHCAILAGKEHNIVGPVFNDPWLSHILLNGKDSKKDTPLHHLAVASHKRDTNFDTDGKRSRQVDKMAFNNDNQNALDVSLQSGGTRYFSLAQARFRVYLRENGAIPGCRTVINQAANAGVNLGDEEEYNKFKESHLIVATLIATVSFAAAFTVPGGYRADKGSDQGFAILAQTRAFQAFVIANTIAMALSSSSVMLHLNSFWFRKPKMRSEWSAFLYLLTMSALVAMVIAFMTGTYAVMGDSPWIRVVVCFLGGFPFFAVVFCKILREAGIRFIVGQMQRVQIPSFLPQSPQIVICWFAGRLVYELLGFILGFIFRRDWLPDAVSEFIFRRRWLPTAASEGEQPNVMVATTSSSQLRSQLTV